MVCVSRRVGGKRGHHKQSRKTCSICMYKISTDNNYSSVSMGGTLAPMCLDGEKR